MGRARQEARPVSRSGTGPSSEARQLAAELVRLSIGPLGTALADLGGMTVRSTGLVLRAPTDALETGAIETIRAYERIGLPLLGRCSEQAGWDILPTLVASRQPRFEHRADRIAAALTNVVHLEDHLWSLASARGGPSRQIPYAFRYQALEWLSMPDMQAAVGREALCLFCGIIFRRRGRPKGGPRCPSCAKQPPRARTGPDHAVAAAGKATWWLRCQTDGCPNRFVGPMQRLRCPDCTTSRISPRKRRPRRSSE